MSPRPRIVPPAPPADKPPCLLCDTGEKPCEFHDGSLPAGTDVRGALLSALKRHGFAGAARFVVASFGPQAAALTGVPVPKDLQAGVERLGELCEAVLAEGDEEADDAGEEHEDVTPELLVELAAVALTVAVFAAQEERLENGTTEPSATN